jgi:Lipopolysaccharide kinase (Kdo/WaaP) family
MMQKEYIDPEFKDFLNSTNERACFENLWNRNDPWFEEPNIGRRDSKKAWSGVSRIQIGDQFYFLKKQENYFTYSVKPPLRQLIVQKEYTNIKLFESFKIPCLDIVYFGINKDSGSLFGKSQGILITKALDNYVSLNEAQDKYWATPESETDSEQLSIKKAVIEQIASLVSKTHRSGLMHRCLYPKHIYIDKDFCKTGRKKTNEPVCRFIDLESARKVPYRSRRQLRDLETLNRRSPGTSSNDKLYFFLKYLNKTSLDNDARKLIKRIQSISR